MKGKRVKKLYSIFSAKWYDYFKKIWDVIVAKKAEEESKKFLKVHLDDTKEILDVGCGTALNLKKIFDLDLKFKKYIGMDFSSDMLKIARGKFGNRKNVDFIRKDIGELKTENRKFDVMLCTWVLSHLDDPMNYVNLMSQNLKPKGRLFLSFYTKPKWYIHFWIYPFAKYIFQTDYIKDADIKKFGNVKKRRSYALNFVTVVEVGP